MDSSGRQAPPPLISTSDPGSFAEKTLRVRLPEQLDQLLGLELPDPDAAGKLRDLGSRLAGGRVRDLLREEPPVAAGMLPEERAVWDRELSARLGRPWSAIPWYFAESLFYLEILAACGYHFPASPGYALDPFEPFKLEELSRPHGGVARAARVLGQARSRKDPPERLAAHLLHALWGNRMDLTFGELVSRYGTSGELGGGDELLIDHSPAIARMALSAPRVDLVVDNAGSELVCDLLLAEALLAGGRTVVLHVKACPFYVSDAMAKDVHATVAALAGDTARSTRQAGQRLQQALNRRWLRVRPDWFWNGPLMYRDWTAGLHAELALSGLVLFKGDVNYRRLLGDRRWNPETPMEELTGYVPGPFAVLRTLKSEIVVDLPEAKVTELSRDDPQWSVKGRYGVARLCG